MGFGNYRIKEILSMKKILTAAFAALAICVGTAVFVTPTEAAPLCSHMCVGDLTAYVCCPELVCEKVHPRCKGPKCEVECYTDLVCEYVYDPDCYY
jgi:hypothetical protein